MRDVVMIEPKCDEWYETRKGKECESKAFYITKQSTYAVFCRCAHMCLNANSSSNSFLMNHINNFVKEIKNACAYFGNACLLSRLFH